MSLSKKDTRDLHRRQLLAWRKYLNRQLWKDYAEWLRQEDPELAELLELTSHRDE